MTDNNELDNNIPYYLLKAEDNGIVGPQAESQQGTFPFYQNLPGIVYRLYPDRKQVRLLNDKLCDITGYMSEGFPFGNISIIDRLIVAEDRNRVLEDFRKVLTTGEPFVSHYRLRHRSGEIRHLLESAAAFRDEQGKTKYLEGLILDVSTCFGAEEALRKSQALYHDLVETSQDLVWQCDAEGRYVYLNPAWKEVFGYALSDMLGRKFSDFQSPESAERDFAEFSRLLQGNMVKGYETTHIGKDGRQIHLIFNAKAVRGAEGQITGTMGTAYDITARKQMEDALQKSEAMFRSLFNLASDSIFLLDPSSEHGSIIVDANIAACTLHGYTRDELIGKPIQFLNDRDSAKEAPGRIELLKKGEPLTFEVNHVRKDGTKFPVEVSARLFSVNNKPYILAIDRDITERRESEKSVRESNKRLLDITSSLGEGIYVFDTAGRITFMNPAAESLLGWSLDELNERGAHDLIHNRRADGSPLSFKECRMHQVSRTAIPYSSRDEIFIRKDGTVFPISTTTTPIIDNGVIVGCVTAFRDITGEKRLEEELLKTKKLESVGMLAGGIAHDFNNLLQVILGNISLAKSFLKEGDELLEILHHAEEASDAAKELSFRLLTFSKGGEPARRTASLHAILGTSAALSLSGSAVTCEIALPPDLSPVEIDVEQMMQVFNNILINAKEAMPQGGSVVITADNVTIAEGDPIPLKKGAYVRVSIEDHGTGIPREILPNIFDPYFSTKDAHTQKGIGLGLSICLSIVRKHEGHISVESRQGKGTTFHVYLPASAQSARVRDLEVSVLREAPVKRILVMDDDERIRNILREMLAHLGYGVVCTRNGEETIEAYKRAKEDGMGFDAVIMDLTVHDGMGGDRAIERLRSIDAAVKAVISSGYADAPVMKHFRDHGFADAMIKPYKIEQLKKVLDDLMQVDRKR